MTVLKKYIVTDLIRLIFTLIQGQIRESSRNVELMFLARNVGLENKHSKYLILNTHPYHDAGSS